MVKKMPGKKRATAGVAKSPIAIPNPAEAISHRAYQRFEARGCEHGHDVEDWLVAEADLLEGNTRQLPRDRGRSAPPTA